jgi:DNA-binding response OmpR family regulator
MRPLRVVLGEDDADLRGLLAATLRADGFEVVEAATGPELLAAITASLTGLAGAPPPALIISDVGMPGMSGLDVVAALRRVDQATPVILISGLGDAAARDRARRLGVSAFFDKPFELDELRTMVRRLVEQR